MYIDSSTIHGKKRSYTRHLLRSSFRESGKVKHATIANLSSCSAEEVEAMKLALKHKSNLTLLGDIQQATIRLGKSIGAVWLVKEIADRLGLSDALGKSDQARLALFQVLARLINQGSRLSSVRFGQRHAACEILGIDQLNEEDLYQNLNWLAQQQKRIEKKLFESRFGNSKPSLFLYDVTSSYLEGDCNELATWGYNRDKKKGKKQIVIGLLTNANGDPLAVRVFEGNALDPTTVQEQIQILEKEFKVKEVTLVGDRGMIKSPQIENLPKDFKYITAITKPQIRKMLTEGVLQYELFSEEVVEVIHENIRYVLRRNPWRAKELAANRDSKYHAVSHFIQQRNEYLETHPRAKVSVALNMVLGKAEKLKITPWIEVSTKGRTIEIEMKKEELEEISLLDGCYAIKSNLPEESASPQQLHDRYCDLEKVERAFRTMKTFHLELRPIYVRKENSTRGHVFIVMLALIVQREIERLWGQINVTVEEGLDELGAIHFQTLSLGKISYQTSPEPTRIGKTLLKAAQVQLPKAFPKKEANVHTKKNLTNERK